MVSLLRWLTASWRAAQPSPSAGTAASTSSNPFRNALHKFQQTKKDKAGLSSAATSGFFWRQGHAQQEPAAARLGQAGLRRPVAARVGHAAAAAASVRSACSCLPAPMDAM